MNITLHIFKAEIAERFYWIRWMMSFTFYIYSLYVLKSCQSQLANTKASLWPIFPKRSRGSCWNNTTIYWTLCKHCEHLQKQNEIWVKDFLFLEILSTLSFWPCYVLPLAKFSLLPNNCTIVSAVCTKSWNCLLKTIPIEWNV